MDRWLERIGYAAQWLSDTARAAAATASESAAHFAGGASDLADGVEEAAGDAMEELPMAAPALLASTAGAWMAARLLRPEEVRWSRAILAGIVGTLLYDAEMLLDQRVLGRKFDTIGPLGEALTDDPSLQRWAGWAAHYAAGVGLAVVYARYLHHRLPGPVPLRGAAFGVLDATTLAWGGLLPVLSRVVPDVPIPPGYAGLAHARAITAQSLLRHTAYGVGVAVTYGRGD